MLPLLLIFSFLLASPPPSILSSPLATVAIARLANSSLLVCALHLDPSDLDRHQLNCTEIASRRVHHYSSASSYYTAVAAGDGFLCGVSSPPNSNTSSMFWWEFHNSTTPPTTKRLYHGTPLDDLAASETHVCGLMSSSGRIYCWRWPELGRNSTGDARYTDLAVGNNFVCGLLPSGKITCFGDDGEVVGKQPDGTYSILAAGTGHACALTNGSQNLVCWGSGKLPNSDPELQYHAIALGRNRTCAIRSNFTAACWGDDGFKLPEGFRPVEFHSIFAKGEVFCGVCRSDYSLVCWGSGAVDKNPVVSRLVLPGPCSSSCPCKALPGAGVFCPSGTSVCDFCNLASQSPPSDRRKKNRTVMYIVMGTVGSGIVLFTLILLAVSVGNCRIRIHNDSRPRRSESIRLRVSESIAKGHSTPVEEFPLELLQALTNGFAEENRIGSGSFGSVYHATLEDGRRVAIKRAEPAARQPPTGTKEQSFLSELALLSRVNHRNVVRLIGYCAEEPELALVYEHMPNGTLHDHLHVNRYSQLSGWAPRLRVALDAARGLEYLHRYAVPPIIHRDIKPSNILLDDTWTAKIADFGLCLVGDGHVAFPTAGTVGYMDPEYYTTERLTEKSDVYSFGVVLLEMLTGRKAIHRRGSLGGEICNVVEFAVPSILADEVEAVLDPALPPPRPSEIEAVQQVGYLAAECVAYERDRRPEMVDVVDELQQAVAACAGTPPAMLTRSWTAHSV